MENLEQLKEEKHLLLETLPEEGDHNERYNINKEKLEAFNERMAKISSLKPEDVKSENGIRTQKRTDRQYNKIWSDFLKGHAQEFSKYMGYGVKEITEIGFREFIDFMDWRESSDIPRYKFDRI